MMMRLLWLLVCALLVSPMSAAVLVEGPLVTTATNGLEIRWHTDVVTGSRVQYGRSATAMSQRADGETTTNHLVVLRGLVPGAKYFYAVGTARVPLATNVLTVPGAARTAVNTPIAATNRAPRKPVAETPRVAPPTRQTWGNVGSLPDHFARHGRDFQARDADDYARQAWEFLQRAKAEGLPMKRDDEGVLRVYDPKTRAFAAYNRDGTTKTYFKPESRDYFERQPGTPLPAQPRP